MHSILVLFICATSNGWEEFKPKKRYIMNLKLGIINDVYYD